MSSGCDNATGPSAPTSPNPPAVAPLNPLSVSAVSPSKGSTGGGTAVTITGSGFQTGAFVTLGAIRQAANVENSATIRVTTPVHDVGPVEIVVTNPDGQAATFAGGYTYASPQSFDFNGAWEGFALAHPDAQGRSAPQHSDMGMRFTIENNRLTSLVCGGATLVFLSSPSVSAGAFSHTGNDDVVTGRIVSDLSAVGTINTGACPTTRWTAARR